MSDEPTLDKKIETLQAQFIDNLKMEKEQYNKLMEKIKELEDCKVPKSYLNNVMNVQIEANEDKLKTLEKRFNRERKNDHHYICNLMTANNQSWKVIKELEHELELETHNLHAMNGTLIKCDEFFEKRIKALEKALPINRITDSLAQNRIFFIENKKKLETLEQKCLKYEALVEATQLGNTKLNQKIKELEQEVGKWIDLQERESAIIATTFHELEQKFESYRHDVMENIKVYESLNSKVKKLESGMQKLLNKLLYTCFDKDANGIGHAHAIGIVEELKKQLGTEDRESSNKINAEIEGLKDLIAEQKKQLLSEKKTCKWFYESGAGDYEWKEGKLNDDEDFENAWQLWISSMPEDIQKRKEMKK